MKPKAFKLKINEPCHENWDGMQVTEKGRFCASCTKVVVDFSKYTDEQIAAYFKKNKTGVCGRIETKRLSNTYHYPVKSPFHFNFSILRFSLAGVLTLASLNLISQENKIDSVIRDESGRIVKVENSTDSIKRDIPIVDFSDTAKINLDSYTWTFNDSNQIVSTIYPSYTTGYMVTAVVESVPEEVTPIQLDLLSTQVWGNMIYEPAGGFDHEASKVSILNSSSKEVKNQLISEDNKEPDPQEKNEKLKDNRKVFTRRNDETTSEGQ